MKKVVVTGASGFVGRAVCRAFCMQGIEVIAVLRNPDVAAEDIVGGSNFHLVYCDSSEFDELSGLIPSITLPGRGVPDVFAAMIMCSL